MTLEATAADTKAVDVVVIGAGQAGLSSAYYLRRFGVRPETGFVVLDRSYGPGGAWQHRWPSLTLSTVNGVHDLPGSSFEDIVGSDTGLVPASTAVPEYYADYEERFELPVHRPVRVTVVCDRGDHLRIETDSGIYTARGIINATGTWEHPFVPWYPGATRFRGRQLHTKDYRSADEFVGKHVLVVGGGISAVQLLDEISRVTRTTWTTRREPAWCTEEFSSEIGRAAVALVEDRVRRGMPPGSVVSVTGLPVTPAIRAARERGVLERRPIFSEITETGVQWPDGSQLDVDVILWCTGFRSSLDHLAPLDLRNPGGGITLTGRLATQVENDPRIHLVGYGPSASTIGANRAGRAAARELVDHLEAEAHAT
ncbi:cation diffusion facilitator CzcD-associated flavoprotein CzcO [Rhodococcus sp. SMB37]|uniref:NAD(P)-binding domain-containing protein n=1 Tax=Rhodococcus sp. SMB37 TaxID=2512213 RepID=UPI0010445A1F|nr:NAD(P)-binding domain-containing protein [Rhodococcus sp. SMB37]TCN52739.1 cation diffusion facilitator CzcD-associated flavoprotein CzcO [Rhodococcus sp. SMB37]